MAAFRQKKKYQNMTMEEKQQLSLKKRAKRANKAPEIKAIECSNARQREKKRYDNMTTEQKQQLLLKKKAKRTAHLQLNREQYPTQHDLTVTFNAIAASLTDNTKKQKPPLPIYTINADDDITKHSIFVRNPLWVQIHPQKTTFCNWEIYLIGTHVSKKFIVTPTATHPLYVVCEVTEIADIDGILLLGDGSHAILLCATATNEKNFCLNARPSDILSDIATFKPNVNVGSKHFGSGGKCYSFGDHGGYEKLTDTNKSSVQQYSSKDKVKELHYGSILTILLNSARNSIDKLLPFFTSVSAMTRNVIQKNLNHEVITGIQSHRCEYPTAHFNFNARTEIFHTEWDVTYTLIFVPQGFHQTVTDLQFQFRISDDSTVVIGMGSGVTISYAAWLLTHRQQCPLGDSSCFINCSAYSNKQLFTNARCTFARIHES